MSKIIEFKKREDNNSNGILAYMTIGGVPDQPVVDIEALVDEIAFRTGVSRSIVDKIITCESDLLDEIGLTEGEQDYDN